MTESKTKSLLLVDGSSYLYRAFHVPNLQRLTTKDGMPTGAVYGVINMLRSLLKEYQPDYMAVVFDARGKTFRHERYPEYKANRPPMPEELTVQIEPLHALVSALGLPLLQVPGVEADDVIGTLASQASAAGMETVISTGDKDMAQLVDTHVSLVNTMDRPPTALDVEGVKTKFGVPPECIIDLLALTGDSSDNIPGIPKVGPKTAAKWLDSYGSLDGVIAHAAEIKGKVGENLRDNLETLELSRWLVTIDRAVELETGVRDLRPVPADSETLRDWYRQLEFRRWLEEMEGDSPPPDADAAATPAVQYETILTEAQLDHWFERLESAGQFAFDTETTSLDYVAARIVGVSFAVTPGAAAYVPLAHDYPGAPVQLDRDAVLARLRPLLESTDLYKIGHHLKYDRNVLANHNIKLSGIRFDSMLESYVLDSTATRHDMDSVALKYLDHKTIKYEDVAGKGAKQLGFNEVPIEAAAPYAAEDADITLRLHEAMWPQLVAQPALEKIYNEIELPLVRVLSDMEQAGVAIDTNMLAQQSEELARRILEIEQEAHREAGQPFNLGSPKQIQAILFDKLQLPVLAKTPKGQPSTAESVLTELALDYPLPRLILDWRSFSKLKSTYTDKLPEQVNPDTGRVHTSYHQAVAATGRLSSSDPNLQNIPVRTEEGRRIRQAFVAREGCMLLAADYSQIELRIMAHLSSDAGLLAAFAAGADVHRATAAEVFGVAPEAVTADQRRSAKAINFGLIYGMSAFGLARQLGIARGAAQEYIDLYFERYPGVHAYMENTREQAREQGFVETVFGRRLYLPDILARNAQRRQAAERTAINAPMQGTAADIIKRAMLALHEWITSQSAHAITMIMQVHDELVFEVAVADVEAVKTPIRECMTGAAELTVPLLVDIGTGSNWDEAH
ncbi:MAG: DNA polymerase I [Gammaproteobacteria bacterium]|nr:MAG: DNA polymerase I [Gammaproteobacteria bacterium]